MIVVPFILMEFLAQVSYCASLRLQSLLIYEPLLHLQAHVRDVRWVIKLGQHLTTIFLLQLGSIGDNFVCCSFKL